ncbi:exo-alpha-sialidase [Paenibacillus alkaliterrae]|uniref:exo-alpha-sialidase n=1 Tax=Paenibacillus alkaliterrae TaxID=320909 RepID=UPI001F2DC171|nr:exo-alpha-sialidase [Paenibacillus alkaliterrae]MCF2937760.1 exo-alpha-sialidase [Paenibacillus alkaliterrae]
MTISISAIPSPVLLQGSSRIAYRDPTALVHKGTFHLYYTLVETESDGGVYMYTAESTSKDFITWSPPRRLTPRSRKFNFSSPGNVIRHNDRWMMCLQSYPRPNGEKYGNADSRLWTMESFDLVEWSEPKLLRVKGPHIPVEDMGRMIDPYLVESVEEPGKWWCFYKQNGVSLSWSYDLEEWQYYGHEHAGENVCILHDDGQYIMFHSPPNGIGVMRSNDLQHWSHDEGLLTFGQSEWEWAKGRVTAGFVLDCKHVQGIGKYVMFYHGTGPKDEEVIFDTHACIGIAWSDDLKVWEWPKKMQ